MPWWLAGRIFHQEFEGHAKDCFSSTPRILAYPTVLSMTDTRNWDTMRKSSFLGKNPTKGPEAYSESKEIHNYLG